MSIIDVVLLTPLYILGSIRVAVASSRRVVKEDIAVDELQRFILSTPVAKDHFHFPLKDSVVPTAEIELQEVRVHGDRE